MRKFVLLVVVLIFLLSSMFSGCVTSGDSDQDGLQDDEENEGYTITIYYVDGTNASVDVTSDPHKVDTDGDNLTDYEEFFYSTDPRSADTDDDGLTDYEEIAIYGTKPTYQDQDGDGLKDGLEINGWDVIVKGTTMHVSSNVSKPDSDLDFFSDLQEYENKTNPLVADTDEDGAWDYADIDPLYNIKVTVDLINFTLLKDSAKPYFYIWAFDKYKETSKHASMQKDEMILLDDDYDLREADISDATGGKTFLITITVYDIDSQIQGVSTPLKINNSEDIWQTDYNIVDYPDEHEYSISGDDGILNFKVKIIRE